MAYLSLIMEPQDQRRGRSAEEAQLAYAQMVRFGASLKTRGCDDRKIGCADIDLCKLQDPARGR